MKQRIRFCQTILKEKGLYKGKIDGIIGPKTLSGLSVAYSFPSHWNKDRRIIGFIQKFAEENNLEYGPFDGFWGGKTQYAYDNLVGDYSQFQVHTPPLSELQKKWPKETTKNLIDFYGDVGKDQVVIKLPYPMILDWQPSVSINKMSCHRLCAEAFKVIFEKTLEMYGKDIDKLDLNKFGGCLNVRKIRGGNRWSTHCLPKNSNVWTPKGVKYIQDLKEGDIVYSFNKGNLEKKKIKNFFSNGYKKIITINLNGEKIECSPEHKILVLKKENLLKEEYTKTKKNGTKKCNYFTEMIEAQYLKNGDKVICLKNSNFKKQKSSEFELLWAEILGMFAGDGCLHHRNGKVAHISFQIPKQDRIRKHAENILFKYYGKENFKLDNKQILSYRQCVYKDFLRYDKKAREKNVPKEVFNWNEDKILKYLEGYIYTDGTIKNVRSNTPELKYNYQIVVKCESSILTENLKLLFNLIGAKTSRTTIEKGQKDFEIMGNKCEKRDSYRFCIVDYDKKINISKDHLYLNRQLNSNKTCKTFSSHCMGHEILLPNFAYKTIKSIENKIIEEPVFDIEVEDNHNFIVNGLVVSNSWGCSVDLSPSKNRLKWGPKYGIKKAQFEDSVYEDFWKIVKSVGGYSLGIEKKYDYQHFQFCYR